MRFGGQKYHEDPTFQDLWHSFCMLLDTAEVLKGADHMNYCYRALHSEFLTDVKKPFYMKYLSLCRRFLPDPSIPVGEKSKLPLIGMNFVLIGTFKGKGDPADNPTSAILQSWITELGGWVLDRQKSSRILQSHVRTPHCYVIIKNDEELIRGTSYRTEETGNNNSGKKTIKSGKSRGKDTAGKKPILSNSAMACRKYAAGNFVFLKWNYIYDTKKQ
jgi:hypothetical protein